MTGLGKWGCRLNTMFYQGEARVTVGSENGEYTFDVELPGYQVPDYSVKQVREEGNTLFLTINIPAVGRDVELEVTFDGDSFSGFMRVPLLGKIRFKDGYRIA